MLLRWAGQVIEHAVVMFGQLVGMRKLVTKNVIFIRLHTSNCNTVTMLCDNLYRFFGTLAPFIIKWLGKNIRLYEYIDTEDLPWIYMFRYRVKRMDLAQSLHMVFD